MRLPYSPEGIPSLQWRDFSRTLELELAAVTQELEKWKQGHAAQVQAVQWHADAIKQWKEENARLKAQLEEANEKRDHTRQYYADRWEPLKAWARADLPSVLREQFFNIIANAKKSVFAEPETLSIQLNLMRHERDAAKADLAAERAKVAELKSYLVTHSYAEFYAEAHRILSKTP